MLIISNYVFTKSSQWLRRLLLWAKMKKPSPNEIAIIILLHSWYTPWWTYRARMQMQTRTRSLKYPRNPSERDLSKRIITRVWAYSMIVTTAWKIETSRLESAAKTERKPFACEVFLSTRVVEIFRWIVKSDADTIENPTASASQSLQPKWYSTSAHRCSRSNDNIIRNNIFAKNSIQFLVKIMRVTEMKMRRLRMKKIIRSYNLFYAVFFSFLNPLSHPLVPSYLFDAALYIYNAFRQLINFAASGTQCLNLAKLMAFLYPDTRISAAVLLSGINTVQGICIQQ